VGQVHHSFFVEMRNKLIPVMLGHCNVFAENGVVNLQRRKQISLKAMLVRDNFLPMVPSFDIGEKFAPLQNAHIKKITMAFAPERRSKQSP
jgi:hypothetical protein